MRATFNNKRRARTSFKIKKAARVIFEEVVVALLLSYLSSCHAQLANLVGGYLILVIFFYNFLSENFFLCNRLF